MRADKTLMAAVVALGGFALYRLVTNKEPNAHADPNLPGPTPSKGVDANADALTYLGDPLALRWGGWYRGRLNVSGLLPPFSENADKGQIAQALTLLGFSQVQVFMGAGELPANWPKSSMNSDAGGAVRYFAARWGQPDVKLPKPSALEAMWVSTQGNNPPPITSGHRFFG